VGGPRIKAFPNNNEHESAYLHRGEVGHQGKDLSERMLSQCDGSFGSVDSGRYWSLTDGKELAA